MPDAVDELIPLTDHQLVFNIVATHLLSQGMAARDEITQGCRYRGSGGRLCAVGVLIPDHLYHESMEGFGVSDSPEVRAVLGYGSLSTEEDLLTELQGIHDGYEPDAWPYALQELGKQFDLDTSCLG